MNQKTYSILFCALLASTFVHEIRAKAAPQNQTLLRSHLQERAADFLTCEVICEGGSSGNATIGLSILVSIEGNLLVVGNLKANVAVFIDIEANLIGLFNGNTGTVIVINLKDNTGVYIKENGWVVKKVTLQKYIVSLKTGLSALLKISGSVSFKVSSISTEILNVFNEIVASLILNISIELKNNQKAGLELLITISTGLVSVLGGPLKGFLGVIGSSVIEIKQDLAGLVNSLQGLGLIISKIDGGFSALLKAGVVLNFSLILGKASNGLEVLGNLLLAIGGKVDLGAALGDLVNDVEYLFKFLAQIGGNVNIGINGLFKVLAQVVALIKGKVGIEIVIGVIIQFLAQNSGGEDLTVAFKSTLNVILEVVVKIGATKTLSGFVTIIKALLAETLELNGVSLSAIIKLLISGAKKGGESSLQVLVAVLIQLKVIVDVSVSIPTCLFILILNINTAFGIQLLRSLGIAIDITVTSVGGGIISFVLKSIPNLLRLLFGDFYGVLASLSVIGKITVALNVAVSGASSGKLDLKTLLNGSKDTGGLIKGLFQSKGNVQLGVSQSTVAKAESLLKTSTSYSFYYGVSASASSG